MKQKWLELTWPQRVVIFIQAFLILLFLILYLTLGRQQFTTYRGEYLRCRTDGEITTYTGKIDGQKAVFTVSPGQTVEYQLGETLYGPYTIVFDPTAVPSEEDTLLKQSSIESLVGVEVWADETRLFRGAYQSSGSAFYLVDPQGELFFGDEMIFTEISSTSGSSVYGYVGKKAPGPYTILKLATAPDVTQRSSFGLFLLGALVCILNALSVLYADALFRWDLRFKIRDVEDAEPSDWEIFGRWAGWIALTIVTLVWFIIGLNPS